MNMHTLQQTAPHEYAKTKTATLHLPTFKQTQDANNDGKPKEKFKKKKSFSAKITYLLLLPHVPVLF